MRLPPRPTLSHQGLSWSGDSPATLQRHKGDATETGPLSNYGRSNNIRGKKGHESRRQTRHRRADRRRHALPHARHRHRHAEATPAAPAAAKLRHRVLHCGATYFKVTLQQKRWWGWDGRSSKTIYRKGSVNPKAKCKSNGTYTWRAHGIWYRRTPRGSETLWIGVTKTIRHRC